MKITTYRRLVIEIIWLTYNTIIDIIIKRHTYIWRTCILMILCRINIMPSGVRLEILKVFWLKIYQLKIEKVCWVKRRCHLGLNFGGWGPCLPGLPGSATEIWMVIHMTTYVCVYVLEIKEIHRDHTFELNLLQFFIAKYMYCIWKEICK